MGYKPQSDREGLVQMMYIDLDGECGLCAAFVICGPEFDGNFCITCMMPYCHGCYIWHNLNGQHVNGEYIDDGEPNEALKIVWSEWKAYYVNRE